MQSRASVEGITITGRMNPEFDKILTPEALSFVRTLQREFSATRKELLAKRVERQKGYDSGGLPDFPKEEIQLRDQPWKAVAAPSDLKDRSA